MTVPLNKLKEDSLQIRRELRERVVGYILTALGLVAGLAWNEAVKSIIEYFFPGNQSSLLAKFIYAIAISIVVVVASIYLVRLVKKDELSK